MPLITRRSSTRSLPRTSVGKCGSILCHCSSLSQNKLLLMIPRSPPAEKQRITIRFSPQGLYWVFTLDCGWMTQDIDVFRSANLFIELHGDDAVAKARDMVRSMQERGDNAGADTWLRI